MELVTLLLVEYSLHLLLAKIGARLRWLVMLWLKLASDRSGLSLHPFNAS
jgi:hypothetical protein